MMSLLGFDPNGLEQLLEQSMQLDRASDDAPADSLGEESLSLSRLIQEQVLPILFLAVTLLSLFQLSGWSGNSEKLTEQTPLAKTEAIAAFAI